MSSIQQIISRQVGKWQIEEIIRNTAGTKHDPVDIQKRIKPVITVSRQRGAFGYDLAQRLSVDLGYSFIDRAITDFIAQDMGIKADMVQYLDEHDHSQLELWVQNLLSDKVFDYDDFIRELSKTVKTLSLRGGIVILGRGANFILHDTPQAFHVRVIAQEDVRIRNLMEFEGMSESEAHNEIHRVDRERAHLVKRYFNKDVENPLYYDIVVNMANSNVEYAVKVILSALRAKGWSVEFTGGDRRKRRS